MKLASYFLISVAFHAVVLAFPISVLESGREQVVPVVLLVETREMPAQAPPGTDTSQRREKKTENNLYKAHIKKPAETIVEPTEPDKKNLVKEAIPHNDIPPPLMDKVAEERPKAAEAALPDIKELPASSIAEPEGPAKSGEQTEEKVSEPPVTALKEKKEAIPPAPIAFARPGYAYNPRPRYPEEARRKGWEGTVILRVLVGPGGNPEDIELSRSSGFETLDQAAAQSVRNWRFHPARHGDRRVESWVKIPILFRLDEN